MQQFNLALWSLNVKKKFQKYKLYFLIRLLLVGIKTFSLLFSEGATA